MPPIIINNNNTHNEIKVRSGFTIWRQLIMTVAPRKKSARLMSSKNIRFKNVWRFFRLITSRVPSAKWLTRNSRTIAALLSYHYWNKTERVIGVMVIINSLAYAWKDSGHFFCAMHRAKFLVACMAGSSVVTMFTSHLKATTAASRLIEMRTKTAVQDSR